MSNDNMNNHGHAGTLICNSLLLCLASVIMRTVGVGFNIYISGKAGAEAIGLYSLVGNVWGFALTLASSGINLAVTRCIAEADEGKTEIRAVMKRSAAIAAFTGITASLLLISGARTIADRWLHDPRAFLPLRLLGLSLPAIALSSALSGYFSAVRRVWKSAVTQLTEQAVKIFAASALLTPMLPAGPEYACSAIILGSAVSDVISCLLSAVLYFNDRKKLKEKPCIGNVRRKLTSKLLGISMPTAFSAYIRSGLTTLEHTLIPASLISYGLSRGEALSEYGTLTGMVLPVVLFPYALIYSFTGLLVPEIAGARSLGHTKRISYISVRIFRLTVMFGFACASVMAVCSYELGSVLYGSREAGRYIRSLSALLPVMYLDTVTDSLLKGLGEQVYTMNVNIADAALSVVLVRLLVPRFGIYGYIAVLYISEVVNFAFSAARLLRLTDMHIRVFRWIIAPLLCSALSSNVCCIVFGLLPVPAFSVYTALILHIVTVSAVFLILLPVFGVLDTEMKNWLRTALSGRRTEPVSLFPAVRTQSAVFHDKYTVSPLRYGHIVSNHYESLVHHFFCSDKQFKHFVGVLAVQISGGFIGKYDLRPVYQGSGY